MDSEPCRCAVLLCQQVACLKMMPGSLWRSRCNNSTSTGGPRLRHKHTVNNAFKFVDESAFVHQPEICALSTKMSEIPFVTSGDFDNRTVPEFNSSTMPPKAWQQSPRTV